MIGEERTAAVGRELGDGWEGTGSSVLIVTGAGQAADATVTFHSPNCLFFCESHDLKCKCVVEEITTRRCD